ncbi:amidohydrolase family protein [Aliikangiella maris]|uniref:Amidohydrolase family protein n=2 Tax=Aliikangiella maris TaxID=3162458 RepID=A0ABV3MJJ0_9GAMM
MRKIKLKSIGLFSLTCMMVCLNTGLTAKTYIIKNATVYTATAKGVLHQANVVIADGKIMAVSQDSISQESISNGADSQNVISPELIQDAQIIDASGKFITPGLCSADTKIGLVEINGVSSTVDWSTKQQGLGASFDISSAINFSSTLIPQNRINGLTRAIVRPSASNSIFAGQGAVIALQSSLDGLIKAKAFQVAVYGAYGAQKSGGSRAAAMQTIDTALTEAKYLRQHESRYLPGFNWAFSQSVADLKALYPVLDREVPLIVSVERADDIERMIALAEKHQIKLVVADAGEAWRVASKLAAAKVPVIINPLDNLPQFESLAVRIDSATRLYQQGVKLLFKGGGSQSDGGTHNAYLVRQSAGNAVAYGLPKSVAIEAMTINIAEVFGIENYGQIEVGMDADVVVWDSDPLEVTANPDWVFIQGVEQALVSRATRLRDRYWELKGNHQQAYIY